MDVRTGYRQNTQLSDADGKFDILEFSDCIYCVENRIACIFCLDCPDIGQYNCHGCKMYIYEEKAKFPTFAIYKSRDFANSKCNSCCLTCSDVVVLFNSWILAESDNLRECYFCSDNI